MKPDRKVKVTRNLPKKKHTSKEARTEIPEVDDKLIGDDLDMKEAQQGSPDNEGPLKNRENNY